MVGAVQIVVFLGLLGSCLAVFPAGILKSPTIGPQPLVSSFTLDPNCPVHPIPVPLPSPLPDAIKKSFDVLGELMEKQIDKTIRPGIAASVVYRDQVLWSKGFGVKNKTMTGAPDSDTIFRIGSVSKVFAALMAYQLYDHGVVRSLDAPLTDFCTDFFIRNPYSSANITLRQMMAQMSGLPRESPCSTSGEDVVNTCPVQTKDILTRLKDQSLIFAPWTVPSYSNLAFALIGRCLVEHFYPQMTYEQYVQKNILDPLGMKNTGFNMTASVQAQMAVGYEPDGSVAPLYDLGWEAPAGQMYSTTNDLNKLAEFFYSVAGQNSSEIKATEVLSPDLRREMQLQVFINRDQLTGFGTPWEIRFESNYTILRKGGNVDGYSALFTYVPDLKLGFNVLFSGGIDEFSVSNDGYKILIPAFLSTLLLNPPLYPYPPDPKVYEGTYTVGTGAGTVNVTIVSYKNQLMIRSTGQTSSAAYLAYVEPLQFQIDFPDNVLPCLELELIARRHEWVMFDGKDKSGVSPGFTIPGYYYGLYFKRQQ